MAKDPEKAIAVDRAARLTEKDYRQRWVTADGRTHTDPVPYRAAVSVRWVPCAGRVVRTVRPAVLAHPAEGVR